MTSLMLTVPYHYRFNHVIDLKLRVQIMKVLTV